MTAEDIRDARDALKMSLADFALWLGLEGENGRRKIRRFEAGEESPSGPIERAIRLGSALNRLLADDPDEDAFEDAHAELRPPSQR